MTKINLQTKSLVRDLKLLISGTREYVARSVNSSIVMLYWQIGKRILGDVLQEKRADYGKQIVQTVSAQLVSEFGAGFSARNLFKMIKFAQCFSDERIVPTLSAQLGWSHFVK